MEVFQGFLQKWPAAFFFPPLAAVTQRKKREPKLERLPKTEIKVGCYDSVEQVLSLNKCCLRCRLNLLAAKWGKLGLRGTDHFHSHSVRRTLPCGLFADLAWSQLQRWKRHDVVILARWCYIYGDIFQKHLKNRQNKSQRSFCTSVFNSVSSHLQKLTQKEMALLRTSRLTRPVGTRTNVAHRQREKVSNVFTHAVSPSHTPMHPSLTDSGEWHWVWGWVILRWLALTHCNWVGVVKKINYMDSVFFGPDLHARWH